MDKGELGICDCCGKENVVVRSLPGNRFVAGLSWCSQCSSEPVDVFLDAVKEEHGRDQ